VSPSPLSQTDLNHIENLAADLGFQIVQSPRGGIDSAFERIASSDQPENSMSLHGLDISPPTDDRPFVNNLLPPGELLAGTLVGRGNLDSNRRALFMLGALLAVVVVLSLAFTIGPLFVTSLFVTSSISPHMWPHLVFFGAIGLGFMLVEISQMQRLTVFLDHPTYGLSVVLFTLLLSGGFGSWLTRRIRAERFSQIASRRLGAMARAREMSPWLFGINGSMSVCASVLAAVISLIYGISTTFWLGVAAYVCALLAFLRTNHQQLRHS
jgi:hypothetical protein